MREHLRQLRFLGKCPHCNAHNKFRRIRVPIKNNETRLRFFCKSCGKGCSFPALRRNKGITCQIKLTVKPLRFNVDAPTADKIPFLADIQEMLGWTLKLAYGLTGDIGTYYSANDGGIVLVPDEGPLDIKALDPSGPMAKSVEIIKVYGQIVARLLFGLGRKSVLELKENEDKSEVVQLFRYALEDLDLASVSVTIQELMINLVPMREK